MKPTVMDKFDRFLSENPIACTNCGETKWKRLWKRTFKHKTFVTYQCENCGWELVVWHPREPSDEIWLRVVKMIRPETTIPKVFLDEA